MVIITVNTILMASIYYRMEDGVMVNFDRANYAFTGAPSPRPCFNPKP